MTKRSRQPSLFLDEFDDQPGAPAQPPSSGRSLVIGAQPGRRLTKVQRAFNRLQARVEALRARLEAEARRLNAALVFHAEHVRPRAGEVLALRKDILRALRPFLHDRRLKRGDCLVLRDIIEAQLEEILAHDDAPDEDLRQLFEELHGMSVADLARQQMDDARSEMSEMLADLGLAVDLPDLHPDMSEEEAAAAAAQFADRLQKEVEDARLREAERPNRGRPARADAHVRRLERLEETRKTSLAGVYRRLARTLHPDLELDLEVRERKSSVMQEVTAAYAAGDLLTLLRLEMAWIDTDGATLTDETLDGYNTVLKEQIAALEQELADLPFHPRYQPLTRIQEPFGITVLVDGAEEVERLDAAAEGLRDALAGMQRGPALPEVRSAIQEYRRMRRAARF